jgi:hypothetical protein
MANDYYTYKSILLLMKIIVYFNSMAPAGWWLNVLYRGTLRFLVKNNHEVILLTKDKESSFYKLPHVVKFDSLEVKMNMDMNKNEEVFQVMVVFF